MLGGMGQGIPSHKDGLIHNNQGQTFVAPGLDGRQGVQNQRIGDGIKDGSLTKSEVKELGKDRKEFHELKNEVTADGRLNPKDRSLLCKELNEMSGSIYELKHNIDSSVAAQVKEREPIYKSINADINQIRQIESETKLQREVKKEEMMRQLVNLTN